jgi:3-oxoacyl-[acyl-carrier protein] reductase
MDVDLRGTFLMSQAIVPHFKEQRSGVIVNMASTNGLQGEIYYAHYNSILARRHPGMGRYAPP